MSNAPRIAAAKRDWGHDESGCTVLHIDMDAFYASLEIARHPQLAGRPVIIGLGNRSVVSAANYEARRYGIYSSMPSARARQLCPDGVFLPVDIAYYREVSRQIFSTIFSHVTDRIERVSVDECYMDISGALLRWDGAIAIGEWMREQVRKQFHITCSVGIAANKLVAKMASTNAKPDGLLLIPRNRHADFVQMMPLRGIPGIGPALERRFASWGISSVRELADLTEQQIAQVTGSSAGAHHLYLAARGEDERVVTPYTPEKSIGAERTFDTDTTDEPTVARLLRHCCDEVARHLRKRGLVARTVTVKLRFADLRYTTRARRLDAPTDAASQLYPAAVNLLHAALGMPATSRTNGVLPCLIRLAGVSAGSLSDASTTAVQLSLDDMFNSGDDTNAPHAPNADRMRRAEQALDAVRGRFGSSAAQLGME